MTAADAAPVTASLAAESLVALVDVLAESLPEFAGVRITRPWALTAAAGAVEATIAGVELHRSPADAAESLARTIRRLRPLDHGNDALAFLAATVHLRLAGADPRPATVARITGIAVPAELADRYPDHP